MGSDAERRELRSGFDRHARAYQRTRPVLPEQAFDDLARLAGLVPGARVLEIGCGTGQATLPLAERGVTVTAVELGPRLAAIARRRLAAFPSARVLVTSFEDFEAAGSVFDAVVAVSSLHWVDPGQRYARPFALLAPGGAMAVAGCRWARPADVGQFWTDVQEDYRAVGYAGGPPPPAEQIGPWRFPPEAAPFFVQTAAMRYPFEVGYSSADYLAILASQSTTRALGEAASADFLARVRRRLASSGWPRLTIRYVGFVTVGRRREQGQH